MVYFLYFCSLGPVYCVDIRVRDFYMKSVGRLLLGAIL